ncbi:hypothetical protein [Prosthecobacter sp.]|uniref:hypothetical protein n=1 Tax=Prosthecobacter sp. TaxID=1965333 RepID=UPI003784A23F
MTLNTISDLPVSPGPAAAPHAALPSTVAEAAATPPPSPALLTSAQLMAALGISRRMLKKWNRGCFIPSSGVRHARRYDLEQVMEALRTHGQPAPAAPSAAPGSGGPAGDAAEDEYHAVPL